MIAAADVAHSLLNVPLPAGVRHRAHAAPWRDRSFVMLKCGLLLQVPDEAQSACCLQLTAQKLAYRKLINCASRPEHGGWGIGNAGRQELLDELHGVAAA